MLNFLQLQNRCPQSHTIQANVTSKEALFEVKSRSFAKIELEMTFIHVEPPVNEETQPEYI